MTFNKTSKYMKIGGEIPHTHEWMSGWVENFIHSAIIYWIPTVSDSHLGYSVRAVKKKN